jgi:hypothetical protein
MIQHCHGRVQAVDTNRNVILITSRSFPASCSHLPQPKCTLTLRDLVNLTRGETCKSQSSPLCNFLYSAFSLSQIPRRFDVFLQSRGHANTNRIIVLCVLNLTVLESRRGENSCKLNNSNLKTEHTLLNHLVPINETRSKNPLFFSRQV